MEIVDDSAATQIEEILAHTPIAGALALPSTDMGEGVFHSDSFTQPGATLRRLLTLSQLDEQSFVRMNADAASFGNGGALRSQRTLRAGFFGKVNHTAKHKGHLLACWTSDRLPLPIQGKPLLGKVLPFANRPSFAIDLQLIPPLPHQMATQIGPVDVEFFQPHLLPAQISTDGFRHTGFGCIGWRYADSSDKAGV